ncbi:MAG: hypothetical protein GY863_16840, partial [bacterium]|nr:hypothetical protein [bacterium]
MINTVKNFFAPAVFDNEEKNRILVILNILLCACLGLMIIRAVSYIFIDTIERSDLYYVPILSTALIAALFLARKGYMNTISSLLIWALWIRATLRFFGYDVVGIMNIGIAGYYIILIAADLLLGRKSLVFFTSLTFLTFISIYIAGMRNLILPENNSIDSLNLLIA